MLSNSSQKPSNKRGNYLHSALHDNVFVKDKFTKEIAKNKRNNSFNFSFIASIDSRERDGRRIEHLRFFGGLKFSFC